MKTTICHYDAEFMVGKIIKRFGRIDLGIPKG
jgi:hypothetical protein